jgi:hypothetical protein
MPDYKFGPPDDEFLPLLQCTCGAQYQAWEMTLSVDADDPREMPCCGRKLYFRQFITITEVAPTPESR